MVDLLWQTFNNAFSQIFAGLPHLIVGVAIAALFIIIGYIVGYFSKIVIKSALKSFKLDEWAKEHDFKDAVGGVELSSLVGSFVKWYVVLVFFTQATAFIQLSSIRTFMEAIVYFAPLVFFSIVILTLGILFGKFARNKVEQTQHKFKRLLGGTIEAVVVFLSLLVALRSIRVDVSILENAFLIAFASFFIVLSIVFGLTLGFAFKDEAKGLVDEIKKNLR